MFNLFFGLSEEELIIDNSDIINNIEEYIKISDKIIKDVSDLSNIPKNLKQKWKTLNEEITSFILTNKLMDNTIGLTSEEFDNLLKELKDALEIVMVNQNKELFLFSIDIQKHLLKKLEKNL